MTEPGGLRLACWPGACSRCPARVPASRVRGPHKGATEGLILLTDRPHTQWLQLSTCTRFTLCGLRKLRTGRHDAGRSGTRCLLFGLRSDKAGTTPPRGLCVVNSIATRGPRCDQR
jgi:hypothetical protein